MSRSAGSLRHCSRRPSSLMYARRGFSTTNRLSLNPLLNLSRFSFSKEAQYFSKERKIPREEYSSHLELIRSSEVDPFAPAPGTSPTVIAALRQAQRGASDMQTSFSLVISNLVVQLEASKAEAKQAMEALSVLQEKHQQQERHALLMVLGVVTLVSIFLFKPDALDIIGEDLQSIQQRWKQFDWQWLGNPPEHRSKSVAVPTSQAINLSDHVPLPKPSSGALVSVQGTASEPAIISDTRTHDAKPSLFSRLFWASAGET